MRGGSLPAECIFQIQQEHDRDCETQRTKRSAAYRRIDVRRTRAGPTVEVRDLYARRSIFAPRRADRMVVARRHPEIRRSNLRIRDQCGRVFRSGICVLADHADRRRQRQALSKNDALHAACRNRLRQLGAARRDQGLACRARQRVQLLIGNPGHQPRQRLHFGPDDRNYRRRRFAGHRLRQAGLGRDCSPCS